MNRSIPSLPLLTLTLTLTAALTLSGCGTSSPGSGGVLPPDPGTSAPPADQRAPHPLNVTVQPDAARAASVVATAQGAQLTATGADGTVYILTVPENALLSDQRLTMTPASVADLPLHGGFVGAVHLEPEGLTFLEPVQLSIQSPRPFDAAHLKGFNSHGLGREFYLQPSATDGSTVTLQLTHFSNPGAAVATEADQAQLAQVVPTAQADRAEYDYARDPVPLVPDFANTRHALKRGLTSDVLLKEGIKDFNAYRAWLRNKPGREAEHQNDIFEGWTLIAQGIEASVKRSSTACTAGNLGKLSTALGWIAWVKRNPRLAPYFQGKLADFEARVGNCATFTVTLDSSMNIHHYSERDGYHPTDFNSAHHVTGELKLRYSVERGQLEGLGTLSSKAFEANGYTAYFGPPGAPECSVTAANGQDGQWLSNTASGRTSQLDLNGLLADATSGEPTPTLHLVFAGLYLPEQYRVACKDGSSVVVDFVDGQFGWSGTFGQLHRDAGDWGTVVSPPLALVDGEAEVSLNESYAGPVRDVSGAPLGDASMSVTGQTRLHITHTPEP